MEGSHGSSKHQLIQAERLHGASLLPPLRLVLSGPVLLSGPGLAGMLLHKGLLPA